jgi:hypothetical protein
MRRRLELPKGPSFLVLVCGLLAFLLLGLRIQPLKRRRYACTVLLLFAASAAGLVGCSGTGRTASISAKYGADTNYQNSTSSAITITIQ